MAGVFVNMDPVGALRRIQNESHPDPVAAAAYVQVAGAAGIAASLNVEGGPLTERDLRILRDTVHTRFLINIPAAPELLGLAMDLRPDLCVLNAMSPSASPPPGGIDLMVHHKELEESLKALQNNGIQTLIFIDPAPEQIKLALQAGADGVVLNAGDYCRAFRQGASPEQIEPARGRLVDGVKLAHRLKLSPWLAGGLGYDNLSALARLPEIRHLIIGHRIITQALFVGLQRAVEGMVAVANPI
jgi:pyridoxine 5-phosphate synthase